MPLRILRADFSKPSLRELVPRKKEAPKLSMPRNKRVSKKEANGGIVFAVYK